MFERLNMNNMLAMSLLAFSGGTLAEGIDVAAATTAITTDGTTAITAIGTAMLGLAAVAVVFKWAKASIFG